MTTKLEKNIRSLLEKKQILLVSHAVLGFPSDPAQRVPIPIVVPMSGTPPFSVCEKSIEKMEEVGVDIVELQIPFSDPQADGSFFTSAQQESIDAGTTVEDCFRFAERICAKCSRVNFVFMTYYNILFVYGVEEFVKKTAEIGVRGIIVPDLPFEEASEYVDACRKYGVAPVFLFTPMTSDGRMRKIAGVAGGFVYCQARAGVTGTKTEFDDSITEYIERCRAATDLPLAMGFGIQRKEDVNFLKGKVDIAICCTQAVKVLVNDGVDALGEFLGRL